MRLRKRTEQANSEATLLIDEVMRIHRKKGNGVVKRQVWVNKTGEITQYSLAYVNHQLFYGDNGRVLGYDNAHGFHHRHYMGNIEQIIFHSFEDLENQFQIEFEVLHEKAKKER